ncbi:MAG: flagellar hook-basal body complex protein FliE [Gammaproteobacteria bacterium]|nr:flagellar hook-basal body complex protein FliE [Gammaproteobacteria bacterium]
MSNNGIDQVLAQMRVMSAQAASQTKPVEQGVSGDFGSLLKDSIDQVSVAQSKSSELKQAFEMGSGDVNLAEVMIAVEKSGLAFDAMVQVRNKLVDAYKDVMNMPI